MKYLKLFEDKWDIPKLKKYIIWKSDFNYDIYKTTKNAYKEVYDTEKLTILDIVHLYQYKSDENELKNGKNITKDLTTGIVIDPKYFEISKNKNIIYQSDKLKDCLEHLDLIIKAKNYNL